MSSYLDEAELRALLVKCSQGSGAAWTEFMRRFHPLISGTVRKILGRADADMVQMVYERLIRQDFRLLVSFEGTFPAFLVYLKNIARNVAMSELQRSVKTNGYQNLEDFLDTLESDQRPEQIVMESEQRAELEEAIAHQKPIYRDVLMLIAWGYSHREAAKLLEVPLHTVRTRATRGKELLRRQLSGDRSR